MENEMKPEIRFKEFTNAWEQHGILSSNRDSGHAESSPYSDFEKNSMPSVWKKVRLGDILKNHSFKKLIVVPVQNGKYVVIQQGNIPIAGYSDLAHFDDYDSVVLFGDHTLSLYKPNKPFALASDGVKIFYSEFTTGNYLYYLLENNLPENEGYKRYSQILKNQEVYIVENKTEQNKISKLFASLDSLIALHQRKCDKLKNVKKSLLEKMFPAEGKDVPEIRFKEFTDAWEQRKLGDMGSTFTGLSGKTKEDFGHGDAKFITYMNVFSNPIADLQMTETVEIDSKQNCVKAGDVFFTTSSETPEEVGMSCVMPENAENTYLNSFCFGYRPTEKFDLNYIAYVLRSKSFRKEMKFLAQGISRYNISKSKVMEVAIPVPSLDEQRKVGQYFSNLDNLITLHQRKCEKLKNIKKALLEKMFC